MKQLHMMRPSAPIIPRSLPTGYRFAAFTGTEAEIADWLTICRHGLLPDVPPDGGVYRDWFVQAIEQYPDLKPRQDVCFVEAPDGTRVATSSSVRHSNGEGYIHMVAALPACRGCGIGHAMLAHALTRLEARGCTHTTLTTDDHRLAAIKTYLDAGFHPVLCPDADSDMRARWDAVIRALRYEPVEYFM